MAERLKDMFFTRDSVEAMANALAEVYPRFEKPRFLNLVFDGTFEEKELKARMRHVTERLVEVLPEDYGEALDMLERAAPQVAGFEAMCLPDYVEVHGAESDWERSLDALALFTKYSSSEFAIRPFINADPKRAMAYMLQLSKDKNSKVRRFASEGCRPRLPWAMALPDLKKDPQLILPILKQLKGDEDEAVRRSVANNLNDISKDNPEIALEVCEAWRGETENTDTLIKHACRTMLKAGEPRALRLFGFGDPGEIEVSQLALDQNALAIGQKLRFGFTLKIGTTAETKVRLEYAVHFVKARGKVSRKVFQIKEATYLPGDYEVSRGHSFADMSTRRHYPGEHQLEIIVNGIEKARVTLQLNG
ncbi:MAG: DNA alkylation repair protein [bacterium]|nr:DNA alkylation repair protein [bacterium]